MNFHGLFATPVGFGENYELTEDELAFITEQETRSNMGNTTSVNNINSIRFDIIYPRIYLFQLVYQKINVVSFFNFFIFY